MEGVLPEADEWREGRNEQQAGVVDYITLTTGEAVRNMNNWKDTDNLPVEVWESLGRTGVNFLKESLNKITHKKFPDIYGE